MSVNPQKSILLLRFLRTSYNSMSWGCEGMLKCSQIFASLYQPDCAHGKEKLVANGYCITSFRVVLVHFGSLEILVQPKDLNICFSTAMKIHTMARIVKKENNFIFSSRITKTCQTCVSSTVGNGIIVQASLFNLC